MSGCFECRPMPEAQRIVGMMAGNGLYPETFAAQARGQGVRLVAAAFRNETHEDLAEKVDVLRWFRVGQLTKMIRFFQGEGVREAVMVGQIAPSNLFALRPDLRLVALLARLKERNAETLFGAIGEELEREGITLLPATTFLEDCLAPAGPICGPKLDAAGLEQAAYGVRIAKELSRLDVGQSVVVREGTVLAAEAFEGTDACIRRGGELGKGKRVLLAKVSKPNQDLRFDVPVVGPQTVRSCREARVSAIVVEAGKTLLLGREEVARLCREAKIALHGWEGEAPAQGAEAGS